MAASCSVVMAEQQLSGNYFDARPLFVEHRSVLLCAFGSDVQAFSVVTGSLLGTFRGHTGLVSCIVAPSQRAAESSRVQPSSTVWAKEAEDIVISSSIDGTIIVWSLDTFAELRRIEHSAPVYEVAISRAAATGRFARGQSAAKEASEEELAREELVLVTGKSSLRTALPPGQASASSARARTGAKESFKVVVYNTHSQSTTSKVGKLRHPRQCCSLFELNGSEYVVFANKSRLNLWSAKALTTDTIANAAIGTITSLATNATKEIVVTGHEHGEMLLWHDLGQWMRAQAGARSLPNDVAPPVTTLLHWHAHPVSSIAISDNGNYLYSGGEEATLVIWQMATGVKNFIPRLGAALTQVAVAQRSSLVAVASMDNGVHVIDAAKMRLQWSLRALCITPAAASSSTGTNKSAGSSSNSGKQEPQQTAVLPVASGLFPSPASQFVQSDPSFRCKVLVEPRRQLAVCNGYPGTLQALDLETRTLSSGSQHQVVQYTRVSKTERHSKMFVPSVTHFQYLDCGGGGGVSTTLLATVDVRRGSGVSAGLGPEAETSLKFFQWDAAKSQYRLGAQVDRPHGPHRVTALAFAPFPPAASSASLLSSSSSSSASATADAKATGAAAGGGAVCATCAVDGSVKLWRAQAEMPSVPSSSSSSSSRGAGGGGGGVAPPLSWTCAYSFRHKDCPANHLSHSRDGSLLAVAQRNVVTLWDPSSLSLRASLVAPTPQNIIFTAFVEPCFAPSQGGGNGEVYLVMGSHRCLAVYDLLSLRLVWLKEGRFSAFAVAATDAATVGKGAGAKSSSASALGWIAVAGLHATSEPGGGGGAPGGDEENEGETDGELAGGDASNAPSDSPSQTHVHVYSLCSAQPVFSHPISAKASSVCFAGPEDGGADTRACAGHGRLLVVTEAAELLVLSDPLKPKSSALRVADSSHRPIVASIPTPGLPAIRLDGDGLTTIYTFDPAAATDPLGAATQKSGGSHLVGLGGESVAKLAAPSASLPSLSLVCEGFLSSLLGGRNGGTRAGTGTGTGTGSGSGSGSGGGASSGEAWARGVLSASGGFSSAGNNNDSDSGSDSDGDTDAARPTQQTGSKRPAPSNPSQQLQEGEGGGERAAKQQRPRALSVDTTSRIYPATQAQPQYTEAWLTALQGSLAMSAATGKVATAAAAAAAAETEPEATPARRSTRGKG